MDAPAEGEHKGLLKSTQSTGWVTFGVGCPGLGGASPTAPAQRSTERRRASFTDMCTNLWPTQASATPKHPWGKNTAIWKEPSGAPQEPRRGVKSKARSQLIQPGSLGSTVQWIPFNPLISSHGKGIVGTFCRHKPLLVHFTTKSRIWI